MRAGLCAVVVMASCGGDDVDDVDLGPAVLKPPRTATLLIGGQGTQGDGIDLTTDEFFGPTGPSDFLPYRDRDYTMAFVGCHGCFDLIDVGSVGSLDEVPLPAPHTEQAIQIPAVIGEGFAVRGHSGCPAAVRILDTLFGPVIGSSEQNGFTGVTIEYAALDCNALTITTTINVAPGSCPSGTFKAGPGLLSIEVDGLRRPFEADMLPAYRLPRGETVALGSWFHGQNAMLAWSGDCQGVNTCTLEIHRDHSVHATLDVPHACVPGP